MYRLVIGCKALSRIAKSHHDCICSPVIFARMCNEAVRSKCMMRVSHGARKLPCKRYSSHGEVLDKRVERLRRDIAIYRRNRKT